MIVLKLTVYYKDINDFWEPDTKLLIWVSMKQWSKQLNIM